MADNVWFADKLRTKLISYSYIFISEMNEGQFLRDKLKEAQKKITFDKNVFWGNIGAGHTKGYQLCHLETLPEPYRSNVQKHFKVKFTDLKERKTRNLLKAKRT